MKKKIIMSRLKPLCRGDYLSRKNFRKKNFKKKSADQFSRIMWSTPSIFILGNALSNSNCPSVPLGDARQIWWPLCNHGVLN
jgi:hypothetical protein